MTEPRHTADTITDDALDALYRRIETLEHVAAGNKRHVQRLIPELEAAEQRAEAASRVGVRYLAAAERFEAAWHSARHRAAVLSAALTCRSPLLGQYAAALARVRALHQEQPNGLCSHCYVPWPCLNICRLNTPPGCGNCGEHHTPAALDEPKESRL
jgi:hypothetical protein